MSSLNNLYFLETCAGLDEATSKTVLDILYYVRLAIKILQILVPIALILWGTIDMAKAVIAGDEKKMKEAKKPLIQRFISAIIVFLIPFLVTVVVNFVGGNNGYAECYNKANPSTYQKPEFNNENDGDLKYEQKK